jgi:hypothetical protein
VLELRGQHTVLPAYLISGGSPPADTAGSWHLRCLEDEPAGGLWQQAKVRNYLDVRRYDLVADTGGWTVVRNPNTGETLALGEHGEVLALEPNLHRVTEREYGLEHDEPIVSEIQAFLRAFGTYPLLALAERLGITDRLSHPELLGDAVFRLDEELESEWTPSFVLAPVDYAVYVPEPLRGL